MSNVAFLVSGQLRGYRYAMPTWKPMLEAWRPDVYMGTPDSWEAMMDAGELLMRLVPGIRVNIQQIEDRPEDGQEQIGDIPFAPDQIREGDTPGQYMRRARLQWHNFRRLWASDNVDWDSYRTYVRVRPDSYFHVLPDLKKITMFDDCLKVPTAEYLNAGGICDRFAIGEYNAMMALARFPLTMPGKYPGNLETRLAAHLEAEGVIVMHEDFRFTQVDGEGRHHYMQPNDQIGGITRPYTLQELAILRGQYL